MERVRILPDDDRSFLIEASVKDEKRAKMLLFLKVIKSKLFPRKQRRRWLWKNDDLDFVPAIYFYLLSRKPNTKKS